MWRDIVGFEGVYQVSSTGSVRSVTRTTVGRFGFQTRKGVMRKLSVHRDGYIKVTLYKGGKRNYRQVHRLVGAAFVENKNGKPEINHKDGNKKNNDHTNLEWCDESHNMQHAYSTGLLVAVTGVNNGAAKLTEQQVNLVVMLRREGKLLRQIAEQVGCPESTVRKIYSGHTWSSVTGIQKKQKSTKVQ